MSKILLVAALLVVPGAASAGPDFLVPCNAFSRLDIEPGSWCRYLVVEESMGLRDSSFLYVAVPAGDEAPEGFFWFEIEGIPVGREGEARVAARLLVSEAVRGGGCGDSLRSRIARVYVRRGEEELRGEDPGAVGELDMAGGDRGRWLDAGRDTVRAMGRSFACSVERRLVEVSKEIEMKRGRFIESRKERETVWFCDDVPLFGMVRYVAERSRKTTMDPPIAGVPVSGENRSETVVELVAFGKDAAGIIPLSEIEALAGGEGR